MSVSCMPGGAAQWIAIRPSPWWLTVWYAKTRLRTKNVVWPRDSRSDVSGSDRHSSRIRSTSTMRPMLPGAAGARHRRLHPSARVEEDRGMAGGPVAKALDRAYKGAEDRAIAARDARIVIFSDLHRGVRDGADDFERCEPAYCGALGW